MDNSGQTAFFAQMMHPSFYPHPVIAVDTRETHISKVFLTGDYVYKIKKPLNLEFLDFTTLENRRHFCLQELALNRRLSRNVYLDVVSITSHNGEYGIDGQGEIVEYEVKMRQLPENAAMTHLLRERKLGLADMINLSGILTDFYTRTDPDTRSTGPGAWETVVENCEENFRQMAPFSGQVLDDRVFQIIRAAVRSFLHRRKSLFDERVRGGKIRDCHGDLKTGHVYFTDDGIEIIDCIEFNERFRFQDIASDLAFLAMDMDFEGWSGMAGNLISDYIRRTMDSDIFVLLDFYKCYRAAVRCKINCIRIGEGGLANTEMAHLIAETRKYLELACQYAAQFTRPMLWVVCGLPASGKSAISGELAKIFGIQAFNSDVIRKRLFGAPHEIHLSLAPEASASLYSVDATALTYGRLLLLVQKEMEKGDSAILDATFSYARHRREAMRLAKDMDADIIFVECVLRDDLLKKRLLEREKTGSVSDARIRHFEYFKNRFEPLTGIPESMHVTVDTEASLDACVGKILVFKNQRGFAINPLP